MKQWLAKHKDIVVSSILTSVVTGVIAAPIGFYSAVSITKTDIGTLKERIAALDALTKDINADRERTTENTIAINNIGQRFDLMKDRVDLAETRVETIKELTELQRNKTVNELEELLRKYGRIDDSESIPTLNKNK